MGISGYFLRSLYINKFQTGIGSVKKLHQKLVNSGNYLTRRNFDKTFWTLTIFTKIWLNRKWIWKAELSRAVHTRFAQLYKNWCFRKIHRNNVIYFWPYVQSCLLRKINWNFIRWIAIFHNISGTE